MTKVQTTIIPKKTMYVQAVQPSDLTAGMYWLNTTTNVMYYSDGIVYAPVSNVNLSIIEKMIGQNALNIIDNTAQASLTAGTNANFIRDVYTTATGYLSSVDLANTTGIFSTNLYNNITLITNAIGVVETASTSNTITEGEKFTMKTNGILEQVNKSSNEGSTTCYLWDSLKNVLATSVFVGNVATFNYSLINATTYYIVVDSGGAAKIPARTVGATYPYVLTNLDFIASYNGVGDEFLYTRAIDSIVIGITANAIVQTNAQTLTATPTKAMIVSNETTAGTGSVTYDISTDGGVNYQTAQTSGNEITLTNTGTSLILKQNLNGVGVGNTASVTNYGVLYW